MLIIKTAHCGMLGDWAINHDCWLPYTADPRPGDLVLLDFSGTHSDFIHTGVVLAKEEDGIRTVEGNTTDGSGTGTEGNGYIVALKHRPYRFVTGYIRPPYSGEQTAERLTEIACSQIGVAEDPIGSNRVLYNDWFWGEGTSGDGYPWCCSFIAWLFAVLARETEQA